jgi:hypothetical protein
MSVPGPKADVGVHLVWRIRLSLPTAISDGVQRLPLRSARLAMLAQRLSPPNLVFPLLNEPQQAPAGPAIGFVRFRREDTVASMCFLVQNRKNGPGQRMGEIANRLAHLADLGDTGPQHDRDSLMPELSRDALFEDESCRY